MSKLLNAAAFATGYVLGARAGRERYDQIVQAVTRVKQEPHVQQAADTVASRASETFGGSTSGSSTSDSGSSSSSASSSSSSSSSTASQGSSGDADVTGDTAISGDGASDVFDSSTSTGGGSDASASGAPTPNDMPSTVSSPDLGAGEEDEVVYSVGPDVEAPIEELKPTDEDDRV